MKRILLTCTFLAVFFGMALSMGCGTAYRTAVDPRSLGQLYDDEAITFEIERKFLADETIKYLDFTSSSYLGRVYIVGEYENKAQISRAKAIASGVNGVRSVTLYLLPKTEVRGCDTATNARLGATLLTELIKDDEVYGTNTDVKMVQCNAVLMGLVDTQAEINRAVAIAKSIRGIRNTTNYLRVYPR